MKIGTLNIDWAKKSKTKNHYLKIEEYLNQEDFDFLILTEAINLDLKNYNYCYFSVQIPENIKYENLNYTKYLNGEKAFRTIIYSKIPAKKQYPVCDSKTCLAIEFETEIGDLLIYATIIGTWFKKQPFAINELDNCIKDCTALANSNPNLIIVGDLNTSFTDKNFTINTEITKRLEDLFKKLKLINATRKIEQNIDHIIIPETFESKLVSSKVFIEKDVLCDHKGVSVLLNQEIL